MSILKYNEIMVGLVMIAFINSCRHTNYAEGSRYRWILVLCFGILVAACSTGTRVESCPIFTMSEMDAQRLAMAFLLDKGYDEFELQRWEKRVTRVECRFVFLTGPKLDSFGPTFGVEISFDGKIVDHYGIY